ncbi:MAG: cbb3-type cytochrome oxidase assembly protein CcoS [Hyphomicrobiales bacterium]|nr:cbb3-type cytochrome oxidase assembly protein CcoS [Hyphomicrobiales bacterium]MDE2114446.1 cbb3-type cytochrome oxidase assembly protein CcoS [Hyphomicrobiales bacterium]
MSILLVLVPAAVALGLVGLAGFIWALKNRQYEDPDGSALRILSDDDIGP